MRKRFDTTFGMLLISIFILFVAVIFIPKSIEYEEEDNLLNTDNQMVTIKYYQENTQQTMSVSGDDIFDAFEGVESQLKDIKAKNDTIKKCTASKLVVTVEDDKE